MNAQGISRVNAQQQAPGDARLAALARNRKKGKRGQDRLFSQPERRVASIGFKSMRCRWGMSYPSSAHSEVALRGCQP
jgi:hypothetical protein